MSPFSPSPAILEWAAEELGVDALDHVRRLGGASPVLTDLLCTSEGTEFVLRRFRTGDRTAEREVQLLTVLHEYRWLRGQIPNVIATTGLSDDDEQAEPGVRVRSRGRRRGGAAGATATLPPGGRSERRLGPATGSDLSRPAILTTRVVGDVNLTPDDPERWAQQLGTWLAGLHALPVTETLPGTRPSTSPGHQERTALPSVVGGPRTGTGPAARLLAQRWVRLRVAPPVLTHRDFWSGNTLWDRDELTGVVDWAGAGLAPRGFDVATCRLDLLLQYGEELADVFTAAYQHRAGVEVAHLRLWDVWAVANAHRRITGWAPNYAYAGRPDLDPGALRLRLDSWSRQVLDAVDG